MKSFGDDRLNHGEQVLVVDLGACTGMDSTFMGTLAGIASRMSAVGEGVLQIAAVCERNRRSLEDLGLDFLMEIDPPLTQWRDQIDKIRQQLTPAQQNGTLGQMARTLHVLDAHQILSRVSDKNAREFSNVVGMLEEQVSSKDKDSSSPSQNL